MNRQEHRKRYEINRRQFLKMVGASGVTLSAGSFFGLGSPYTAYGAVAGKDSEERALSGIKALKGKMKGDSLVFLVPSGSEGSYHMAKPWWEEATGIKIEIVVVPYLELLQKAMNIAVTRSKDFDAILISPVMVPDLVESKLALDITDQVKKYNPQVSGPDGVVPPLFLFGMYKENVYALNTDGDVLPLMLRRDLLTDPDKKKAFEDKYGYSLARPVLWEQLFDQIKFFTDKDKQFYGAWLFASPYYAKWLWLQLFTSQGILPFDRDMNPQIAGPEGVKALEEMIAIKPYLHPGASTGGYSEMYAAYAEGNVYAATGWPSFIKYMNLPELSKVTGKLSVNPVPGRKLESGTVLSPAMHLFGWMYMVSRYSRNPEIAYLMCQWLYSPRISTKVLPAKGGYMDPYRYTHLKESSMKNYTSDWKEAADGLLTNLEHVCPELQVKGAEEYMTRLDENIVAALEGQKKPEKALKDATKQWEKITKRYGRESQREQYNFYLSTFGPALRKELNLPDPPKWIEQLG